MALVFPLYPLKHVKVEKHGVRTLVRTLNSIEVLDDKGISGDFAERRLKLRAKGEDVYKLKQRCETIGQVLQANTNTFVDGNGDVKFLVKSRYGKCENLKVVMADETGIGTFLLHCYSELKNTVVSIHSRLVTDYVEVLWLKNGQGYIPLTNTNNEEPTKVRRKI